MDEQQTSIIAEDQPQLTSSYTVPHDYDDQFKQAVDAEVDRVGFTPETHARVWAETIKAVAAEHPEWGVRIDPDPQQEVVTSEADIALVKRLGLVAQSVIDLAASAAVVSDSDKSVAAELKPVANAPQPSVGRIVHFVNGFGQHLAAIIVGKPIQGDGQPPPKEGNYIHLHVFSDLEEAGMSSSAQVASYDEGCSVHTWHWPERE